MASDPSHELAHYMVQFLHPDKIHAGLPGANDETAAALFGLPLDYYRQIKAELAANARRAAQELLDEAEFAARVERLPFQPGAKIVALGDSITDDSQSWAEILRHVLDLRRPNDGVTIVNAGISGDTTADMNGRFLDAVIRQEPDWIICMAGTNDARCHGLQPIKTMVSLEETGKNLAMLRAFAARQAPEAHWIWMTPALTIAEQIAAHWFLGPLQLTWSNDHLRAIGALMQRQADPAVDLAAALGNPPNPAYLLDDGLHPSLAGQQAILRALVARLSS